MRYPTNSVELYLPWNDTWIGLPTLPELTDVDGIVYNMTHTLIMSLAISGNAYSLHLLGGNNVDFNNPDEESFTYTNNVWQLMRNDGNNTYYWAQGHELNMGNGGVCCRR